MVNNAETHSKLDQVHLHQKQNSSGNHMHWLHFDSFIFQPHFTFFHIFILLFRSAERKKFIRFSNAVQIDHSTDLPSVWSAFCGFCIFASKDIIHIDMVDCIVLAFGLDNLNGRRIFSSYSWRCGCKELRRPPQMEQYNITSRKIAAISSWMTDDTRTKRNGREFRAWRGYGNSQNSLSISIHIFTIWILADFSLTLFLVGSFPITFISFDSIPDDQILCRVRTPLREWSKYNHHALLTP